MSDKFKEIYRKSIEDPENFWREASDDIFWFKKPSKILNYAAGISIFSKNSMKLGGN